MSHYLSPSDPIKPSKIDPVDMNEMLKETMANADGVLEAAKVDQKNIKQTLKMTNAAAVLDDLEDLRWYVYPQECAQLLASQKEPELSVALLGPLIPNRRTTVDSDEHDESTADRKRKVETMAMTERSSSPLLEAPSAEEGKVEYRDGTTNGVSTLTSLDQRIRDGALSERCEILNKQSGEWVQLRALVGTSKKLKVKTASPEPKTSFSKKEARDTKSWGKGSVTAPSTTTLPAEVKNERESTSSRKSETKYKHKKPPAKMMRLINQAIFNWDMIENGDRLLLGLSGGKDSLSLLHCLLEFRRKMPINFELELCTIDPMTPSFDPSPLIPYVESLGLKYHYIRDDIVARANSAGKDGKMVSSLCAFCARMKRGNLYSVARKNKCNKLVLAQVRDVCSAQLESIDRSI